MASRSEATARPMAPSLAAIDAALADRNSGPQTWVS